ncbi:MAG TPA: tetratricopeptide repeat protein [Candidatus Sulfopaludibacter sp.]|jgi:tetratricopeptide (TPR) repeat protein|nr:tetratricopeptide repeat protein [Candidatus Sulfopaludibacter sp.]
MFTACSRQPVKPALTRLAVLRFENLSPDSSADWMGRAFSEVISAELSSVPGMSVISSSQMHALERQTGVRPVSAPGISSERSLAIFQGANRVAYGDYYVRGGRLQAQLTIEDPATGRMERVLTAEAPAGDVYGAASNLAHQISSAAGKYGTTNEAAVQAYITASEGGADDANAENAARAIAADPNFGPAYRLLAGVKARQKDTAGALAVLDEAIARGGAIPPAERARIELEAATLRNDQSGRRQALLDLTKAEPQDIGVWRSLAELSYAMRDYPHAVTAYEKVLAAEPDSPPVLNVIGYAYAYSGNLDAAVAALKKYRQLLPKDPNALDSLGDVYLISGHLAEAAQAYLQAAQLSPTLQGGSDLFKAAMARLMSGDIPAADALEKQCEETTGRANDPATPYRQAEWAWLTGRRKQAVERLTAFAQNAQNGPMKELASRAYSELALWSLLENDRTHAADFVSKALQVAGPASAPTAFLMRYLLDPAPRETPANRQFLAYWLLLNKQFPQAATELQRLYDNPASSSDEALPILLAWARVETGHENEAADLLRFNPVPPLTGPGLFTPLYFPRLYQLRAKVAEKQNRPQDAQAAREIFQKLSPTATAN